MSTHLLGSTILMALLVIGVFVAVARVGRRHHQGTTDLPARRSEAAAQQVSSTVDTPAGLGTIFVVVAVVLGALSVAAVGGPVGGFPNAFALSVGLVGLLLTGFLFLGTYVVVRQHGLGRAQGIAAALFGVGGVGILVIAANLVFNFV